MHPAINVSQFVMNLLQMATCYRIGNMVCVHNNAFENQQLVMHATDAELRFLAEVLSKALFVSVGWALSRLQLMRQTLIESSMPTL